jgi:hypothetical protein
MLNLARNRWGETVVVNCKQNRLSLNEGDLYGSQFEQKTTLLLGTTNGLALFKLPQLLVVLVSVPISSLAREVRSPRRPSL